MKIMSNVYVFLTLVLVMMYASLYWYEGSIKNIVYAILWTIVMILVRATIKIHLDIDKTIKDMEKKNNEYIKDMNKSLDKMINLYSNK